MSTENTSKEQITSDFKGKQFSSVGWNNDFFTNEYYLSLKI